MTLADDSSFRPLRRIAVATDLSPGSALALERATRLAKQHRAHLTLVHVVPIGLWDGVPQRLAAVLASTLPTEEAVRLDAEAALRSLASKAAADGDLVCDVCVRVGRTAAEIADAARALDADLLVVGAHGRHPVRDLLLGTTVQKLLRLSPSPVLVVKTVATNNYAVVLAPTDMSDASRQAVSTAAHMLPQARLHLAHAFELPYDGLMRHAGVDDAAVANHQTLARERILLELADWADATSVAAGRRHLRVEHGYPPECISRWIGRTSAQLVVMAAQSKVPLDAPFIGSVSLHTALTAPCDVLLLRTRAMPPIG